MRKSMEHGAKRRLGQQTIVKAGAVALTGSVLVGCISDQKAKPVYQVPGVAECIDLGVATLDASQYEIALTPDMVLLNGARYLATTYTFDDGTPNQTVTVATNPNGQLTHDFRLLATRGKDIVTATIDYDRPDASGEFASNTCSTELVAETQPLLAA